LAHGRNLGRCTQEKQEKNHQNIQAKQKRRREESMKTFTITKDQVKMLADTDGAGVQVCLRDWFPEAFKPEWEEVATGDLRILEAGMDGEFFLDDLKRYEPGHLYVRASTPLFVRVNLQHSEACKIENGKIWRRKA